MAETDLTRFTEAELMAKHQRGIDAIEAGRGIRVTMEQLEAMADEKNTGTLERLEAFSL